MCVPKYYEMYQPILRFLADGKHHDLQEMKKYLIDFFRLSQETLSQMLPSGRQTYFANRLGWARTYLKKAGLIDSADKGVYFITQEGQRVVREAPPVINNAFLMRYESFRAFVRTSESEKADAPDNVETPDDAFENAFQKINQNLADEILAEVMKLSPIAFEKLVLDLMSKMGYGTFDNAAAMTSVSGDEGIDGIIMEDKLGFDLIYVQVKRWGPDHLVGRPDVQGFVGAIAGKGGKGLFVTTSGFTKQAIDYARRQHVILLDGQALAYQMIAHNFGVSTKRTFEIKVLDSDLFADYQDT